ASSKPATSESIAVAPDPWLTPVPVSGISVDWCAPSGIVIDDACVMFDVGRGAAYTGTFSVGAPADCSTTSPLASAWYTRGFPPWVRSTVGSIVLVSLDGSIVSVTSTVEVAPAPTVTEAGETE